jgi:hypothetical protein
VQEIHTVCREIHGQERVPGGLRQNISGRSFGSCMMNHGESAEARTPNRGGTMKKGDGKGTWQGYIQSEVDAVLFHFFPQVFSADSEKVRGFGPSACTRDSAFSTSSFSVLAMYRFF